MESMLRFNTVSEYNAVTNNETLHPLVSVADLSKADPYKADPSQSRRVYFGFYTIFLKDVKCGDLMYGRDTYDYQEGTLVFMAPGQVADIISNGETNQPKGYALLFHADFLTGTSLGKHINDYGFFAYQTREALHLSEKERHIVLDCFAKIEYELQRPIDKHSKKLIASNIELFLDYCTRFYERQFITREHVHGGILSQFEQLLNDYFLSEHPSSIGLPSVAYFARELNLSPNYFGDLFKKETGISAQDYIHTKLMEVAREKIFDRSKSLNQVAAELGFKYQAHFTRLFKQKMGCTPQEFRVAN